MNDEILKAILEALQGINDNISAQNEQLDRMNNNIESVIGEYKDRTFLSVVASVYNE